MRGRRDLLGGLLAVLLVLLGTAIAIPLNVVSGYFPAAVISHRILWVGVAGGGVLVIATLTLLSRQGTGRGAYVAVSQVPPVAGWVDRDELAEVISALTAAGSGPVVLTTGLVGAGGFGKTMLAAQACQDPAIRRRFRGGIVWVTIGRDLSGAGLAARISEVVRSIGGDGYAFTSPEQAGHALAAALAARERTLVVADDVWTTGQLQPFLVAAQRGRLLVTTRRPPMLAVVGARRITVDAVTDAVAQRLLARDLPCLPDRWERELLELTGGWPLLLSLVNRRLAEDLRRPGGAIDAAAEDAVRRLRQTGPAALDIADSGNRHTAVAATIDYSLDALEPTDRDRFLELGIFAEDTEVPLAMIALLWQGTAGLNDAEAQALCERLDGLSLLSLAWAGNVRVMVLHDVIRDFAVSRLGPARCAATHTMLIGTARQLAARLKPGEPKSARGSTAGSGTAWWRLPETSEFDYLWQNLTYHMQAAGLETELDQVCCDLRFLATRLRRASPAAVESDLIRSAAPIAARLRRAIAQNAHLLSPIEPAAALTTTLTSRLGDIPEVADQLPILRSDLHAWTAWPDWPLPDQPDTLIRTITGHQGLVNAVAISPDSSWLATASEDGTARIWAADGTIRATLPHQDSVDRVKISPDSSWLATADRTGTVRIWSADGTLRVTLTGHEHTVTALAISPDSSWLATADRNGTVRIWAADGTLRATLTGSRDSVRAVAISPDGSWLIAVSLEKTVRIWAADGTRRATLTHQDYVDRQAISPDSSWLFTAERNGTVRIWAADGTLRATLTGSRDSVRAVAMSPDGTWLATANRDRTVRIWAADGTLRATLTGHQKPVDVVAISPDGSWLVTASEDGMVRIWAADGTLRATLTHRGRVWAVEISPDGSWLATASEDGTARIWAADGALRATLTYRGSVDVIVISPDSSWLVTAARDNSSPWPTGSWDKTVRVWAADGNLYATLIHRDQVNRLVISPDSSWLATASRDKTVRIWAVSGTPRAAPSTDWYSVRAVAVSPDGSWLATAGEDGTAQIWAADGTLRATLTHRGKVRAVEISPDGSWLATASEDGTARIWSADGTLRATLTGHQRTVTAVAISPDCTWLATASGDLTARIWSADGTLRATLAGHRHSVRAVAISPDGTWLATAGWDGTVRIWAADGTLRATLTGHRHSVDVVAVSPDGSWLATAGEDGTARIWAADGTLRATLTHRGKVRAVTVSPDGSWLAIASEDGTARIWSADGTLRATLIGHQGRVTGVAISPDGSWLATAGGDDGTARIWSAAATGADAHSLTAIRADSTVATCTWLPGDGELCIAGANGLYRFSLHPPYD